MNASPPYNLPEVNQASGGAQRYEAEQQRRREKEEERRVVLKSLLDQNAYERLKRIEMVKPEKARLVEEHLIQGGLRIGGGEKISEEQLVAVLSQLDEGTQSRGPTIKMNRRRFEEDSDSGDELLWKG